ncbi:MAG TPA: response regulator [Deltaproteobacteria bacterium]|nr:response regulator [Deltaproteobacteria bacterium]HQI80122.1 response regulator [Deltaproteobacteria bacterium]
MKILIVDDDFTSRILLQEMLSPYGQCHVAVNGREAIEAFMVAWNEGSPYDLVCLDIMMPEVDGQTVLKGIRAMEETEGVPLGNGVKIIMTSALDDKENVLSAFKELCDAYLVKPINKVKLLGYLRDLRLIQA